MIKLQRQVIRGIRAAETPEELHRYLQNAVELEHSTIPPYLTALFSLKPGTNQRIAQLVRGIVIQEMLHMSIAANILIAIGGRPAINQRGFIPQYPGPLPMHIGGGLQVGIEAFSIALVENTFMKIEEPEQPIPVQTGLLAAEPEYATIGEFYDAIKAQIVKLGPSIFKATTAPPQVVSSTWFPPELLFPITGPDSACRAIDIIKLQGEGTSTDPFECGTDPAHFYKFGEIAAGKAIVPTEGGGYAYAGAPIPFDAAGVWPLRPNCKIADFPVGTQARTRIEQYAYNYSALLNVLHDTFNGHPERLDAAIGVMYDLRVLAVALMSTDAGNGQTVGPSYEYVHTQGGMPEDAPALAGAVGGVAP